MWDLVPRMILVFYWRPEHCPLQKSIPALQHDTLPAIGACICPLVGMNPPHVLRSSTGRPRAAAVHGGRKLRRGLPYRLPETAEPASSKLQPRIRSARSVEPGSPTYRTGTRVSTFDEQLVRFLIPFLLGVRNNLRVTTSLLSHSRRQWNLTYRHPKVRGGRG